MLEIFATEGLTKRFFLFFRLVIIARLFLKSIFSIATSSPT